LGEAPPFRQGEGQEAEEEVSAGTTDLGWHVISGEHLLECLRRVAAGEDPEFIFIELWANADHERVDADD
jgi:hypothetical protein